MADVHFGWDGKSVCGAEGDMRGVPDDVTCLKCLRISLARSNRIIEHIQRNMFDGSMEDMMLVLRKPSGGARS